MKVIVYHSYYGCDTGCCGHIVEIFLDDDPPVFDPEFPGEPPDNDGIRNKFTFEHPRSGQEFKDFAEQCIVKAFGAEHVKDLDWEHCLIVRD